MGSENRRMQMWMNAVIAACMVAAVSGMVNVYGLEDVLFFNKGIISLGVFFLGAGVAEKARAGWRQDRRKWMIAYLMAYGLVFSEILGTAMRLAVTKGGVNLRMTGAIAMAGAAVVLALLVAPFFLKLFDISIKPGGEYGDGRRLNRVFWAAWGILFVGYLPCILAFYPGLYACDMMWQWWQFDSWWFTTHHPLIHTLFSGAVIELGKLLWGSYNEGLFLHSLVQTLFFTGAMAYGIRFMVKRRMNRIGVVLAGLFFLLFPFFPVMGITTTKDTIFSGFFLITFADICDMVIEGRFYHGRRLALFIFNSVCMCLFRNNTIYGLAVMACCLVVFWAIPRGKKRSKGALLKAAGLIVVCIFLSQAMFTVLEKSLHAGKGSKAEMMSLPVQQIARSYVFHQEEFSEEDKEELFPFFDESTLLDYTYYLSDPVKGGLKMEGFNLADFLRLWMKLGMRFPGEYVKAPLYNTMGLWYMGGDSSCTMSYKMSPPFDEEHTVEIKSKLPWLKAYYSWFIDENLQKYLPGLSVFFYTSFYSWCVALAAGILVAKRKYRCLIPTLFLACYGFTLIFGPCMAIRYFLAVMLCIPILAVMVFQADSREDGDVVHGLAGSRTYRRGVPSDRQTIPVENEMDWEESAAGTLHQYANISLIEQEKDV